MKKKIISTALLLIVIIAAFFAGGYMGFNQGFSYSFAGSANEASAAMSVLQRIETERYEEAKGILNALIDSHILTYENAKFADDYVIPFSPILFVLDKEKFNANIKKVLLFRSQHPSENEIVREHVKNVKNKY